MSGLLIVEQLLNGLQLGLMLFLIAAGLTLIFGIMDMINLAHGSLFMVGAFLAATVAQATGSFWLGVLGSLAGTALIGVAIETTLLRRLYQRDHLSQVLATFALILIANDGVRMLWGDSPLELAMPSALSGPVMLPTGFGYSAYRLVIIAAGVAVAVLLYLLIARTRLGARVRAGAADREMTQLMGVHVDRLFTAVFALGAALCALAGALLGPLVAIQSGMGESVLIQAFVVIVIGGIGSIRGALVGALLVGMIDTIGRAFLPSLFKLALSAQAASNAGPAVASLLIYVLMIAVLFWKPAGLFPARG